MAQHSKGLTITDITRNDEGFYYCNATNNISSVASKSAYLTVNYPPKFLRALSLVIHKRRTEVKLSCQYEGKPMSSVEWFLNGTKLDIDANQRLTTSQSGNVTSATSSLTIVNPTSTDVGKYKCVASNGVGANVHSTEEQMTINVFTLRILNPDTNYTTKEGESVTLECNVSRTDSPVTIVWSRNGNNIKATGKSTYDHMETSKLTITKVLAKDSGDYECVAKDSRNTASTTMKLTVNVHVQVDMDITIENSNFTEELRNKSSSQYIKLAKNFEKQILFIYQNESGFKNIKVLGFRSIKQGVITRFRVVFEINVDQPSNAPPPDVRQKLVRLTILKLNESNGVLGNITVNPGSILALVSPPPPRNFKHTDIKSTQIFVDWEPPSDQQYYPVINGYMVQHREFKVESWKSEKTSKDTRNFVINNLKPATSYVMSVLAVNDMGKGVPSDTIEPKTPDDNIFSKIWREYKWIVLAVGAAVILLMFVCCYFMCCLRRNRRRERRHQKRLDVKNHDNFGVADETYSTARDLPMAQYSSRFREIPRNAILFGDSLGSGQFGQVVSGYLKDDKIDCAIKMLKEGASQQDYKDLMNELDIMSSIDAHPNIINLIGACSLEGPLYVIIELAENGCLLDYLCKHVTQARGKEVLMLTSFDRLRIALDVAKGLKHLARHRCVHRDLAARNVLLGTNMTAKLTDFGLARDVYERGYYAHLAGKLNLPVRWMAIEAIETLVATKESDIWSFGVLLWEIESGGKVPYQGLQMKEILKILKKGKRLRQPIQCSNEIYAVMKSCWNVDPLRRPTIENLTSVLDKHLSAARREDGMM